MAKQSSAFSIFPPFGVTVMSLLLETFLPTVESKYHGLHQRSLAMFFRPLNAAFTLSLVMSPEMPRSASVAVRPARYPIWAKLEVGIDEAYFSRTWSMWFWSGSPESSVLNSALIRNLPSQAGPSSFATDGSFGGVELAQMTESIRPCCSMAWSNGMTVGPV